MGEFSISEFSGDERWRVFRWRVFSGRVFLDPGGTEAIDQRRIRLKVNGRARLPVGRASDQASERVTAGSRIGERVG